MVRVYLMTSPREALVLSVSADISTEFAAPKSLAAAMIKNTTNISFPRFMFALPPHIYMMAIF